MSAATRTAASTDWTQAQDDRLAALYGANWSIGSIAGEMGRSPEAIKTRVKHCGFNRPVIKGQSRPTPRWAMPLTDQTDAADDIMAARMAASAESFGDHEVRTVCYGRPVSGGLAAVTGWQTVGEQA